MTEETDENSTAGPTSRTRPQWATGAWVLALLLVGAGGAVGGHQWGLYDRSAVAVDVAAAGSPSPSTSPSSSPSSSSSKPTTATASACKGSVDKYVRGFVRRSDLTAEHPKPTKDVTACRWVSEGYPRITVSVVAGAGLDNIHGVLDDIWTETAPMENERMYQYGNSQLIGYWNDPDGPTEGAAIVSGMNGGTLPTDEGMAATSVAARVAQAHRDQ
jgi:hypothetical protein